MFYRINAMLYTSMRHTRTINRVQNNTTITVFHVITVLMKTNVSVGCDTT